MGIVEIGRGKPLTLFAPGGNGDNLAGRMSDLDRVKGTKIGFAYEHSGLFESIARIRRQADRDAAEVRALAREHKIKRAVGFSRGARAIIGALAEDAGIFERIALVIPPRGTTAGNWMPWLESLSQTNARAPTCLPRSSSWRTKSMETIPSMWRDRGRSSWAPVWRFTPRARCMRIPSN